jgi:succinylarginine dihydrolase
VRLLRELGFGGSDTRVLKDALAAAPELLHGASSASSMWAANAATVVPASDSGDGRTHFVPANLISLLHRSIEARFTERALGKIFSDTARFVVHAPLPACDALADEGAANHTRLFTRQGALHLFAWGRRKGEPFPTSRFPARQTHAASASVARLAGIDARACVLWQQDPRGIDAGAFHTDVLAVGNASVLLLHERAFCDHAALLARLKAGLGDEVRACVATEAELPLADAVSAYCFNSQLLSLPSGKMRLIAPLEARDSPSARAFLERAVAELPELEGADYLDVNGSMKNGGGPACLRLRVALSDDDARKLSGSVLLDARLEQELRAIVERRYRDRLELTDMADPELVREAATALDEITRALGLHDVYDGLD